MRLNNDDVFIDRRFSDYLVKVIYMMLECECHHKFTLCRCELSVLFAK